MIRLSVPPESIATLKLTLAVAHIPRRGAPRNVRALVNRLLEDAVSDGRTVAPADEYAREVARVGRAHGVFLPRGRTTREQIVLLLRILDYLEADTGARTIAEQKAEVRFYALIFAWEPGEMVN